MPTGNDAFDGRVGKRIKKKEIRMKVKELIEKLQEFDGDIEVKTDNRYRQEVTRVTMCKLQYKSLDEMYVYIG